jgi:hypothetical protein
MGRIDANGTGAVENLVDRHTRLQTRQRCPEAVVDTQPERQMRGVGGGEIKPVSGTEPTRVTIGGAYEYDDATARRDLNAGYLSIGDGNPGHTLQRRICP